MFKASSRFARLRLPLAVSLLLSCAAMPWAFPGAPRLSVGASAAPRTSPGAPPALQAAAPRRIAFTVGGSNNTTTEIFVANEDGTGQQRLTNNGFEDREPTWSPDGSQIAFSSNRGGNYNLYRMNPDGTGLVPLTNSTQAGNIDPSWSPDAQRLAFVSNRGGAGRNEIWVIGADGRDPQRLTVNVELTSDSFGPVYSTDREPAWSPDGTRVAFSSNRDGLGNFDVYVMNADGSNPVRLTNSPGRDGDPAWSPDGARIAFSSTRDNNNPEIYVMNADGTGQTNLTNTGASNEAQPSWSQDGTSIAYVRLDNNINSVMTLYRMGPDGSNQTQFVNNAPSDSWLPAWQTLGGPAPPAPPQAPGYRLTGRVLDRSLNPSGTGVAGVVIELSGARSALTQTDANGNYFFDDLAANSTYTVRPTTTSYGFVPSSQTFTTGAPEDSVGSGGTITRDFSASPIVLQFTAAADNAAEGGGPRAVALERNGFITGESAVNYAVVGGTASAGSDYLNASGTVRFAPGQSTASFALLVIDDSAVESDETVIIKLSSPSGAFLGSRDTFVLTIKDNDPQPNPIQSSDFFVTQHYRDFLNREPDQPGLAFWVNEIEQCGSNAQCREVKRINVSAAFFLSIEFQQTGFLAYRARKAAFGNLAGKPVPLTRAELLQDVQVLGNGVVVNADGWEQKLEQNKQAYFDQLVASARFNALYPQTLTPGQFVDALNANAGGALSSAERDALVAELGSGAKSRAQVLRTVAEDPDLSKAEFNRAFVLMQYFGYLRRDPDAAPDQDFSGYNFWLGKLNDFNGDYIAAEMVKAFLDSIEYRNRFAQ